MFCRGVGEAWREGGEKMQEQEGGEKMQEEADAIAGMLAQHGVSASVHPSFRAPASFQICDPSFGAPKSFLSSPCLDALRLMSDVTRSYLTESVYKVVWQKSVPAQILQLILDE